MPVRIRKHRRPLSLDDWPDVDERALPEPGRNIFRARRTAVELYSKGGETLERVAAETGLHRAALFRLIDRALRPHPDGRLWGYRALVPHSRVQAYERTVAPRVLVHVKAGNAGVFAQLLQRHPSLAKQLREEATSGRVYLQASGQRGRLAGLKAAVGRFHDACRELGLGGGDYPLNQQDKAVRTMARALRAALDDNFVRSARAAGTRIKPASALRQSTRAVLEAFDTVEYDAHKLDLRLKVVLEQDPLGGEHSLVIERLWLLAVIDVATRCVLGWSLGFGRECNRFDAIETIKRALVPPSVPQVTLPGLKLMRSGGFVSQVLPQTQFACWRQIRLDNARAHLATTSLDVLCDSLGCTADFGPAYEPDDRPFIERFFGTLTTTLSRRLPGAIPPRSRQEQEKILQRLRDPKESIRLLVTAQELQELLEVTIWNYHGTPHSALGGLTPLEMMSRHVLGINRPAVRLRVLPALLRKQPALLHHLHARAIHERTTGRAPRFGWSIAARTRRSAGSAAARGHHRRRRNARSPAGQRHLARTPALPLAASGVFQGAAPTTAQFRGRAGSHRGVPHAATQAGLQEQAGSHGHLPCRARTREGASVGRSSLVGGSAQASRAGRFVRAAASARDGLRQRGSTTDTDCSRIRTVTPGRALPGRQRPGL